MTLGIIGAGFGRTGTESMKLALEQLGFGPCHHMTEVLSNPAQKALWQAVVDGEPPRWDVVFQGYRSALDWPSAVFWRELAAYYPDAKVILTVRSPEDWHRSFSATILSVLGDAPSPSGFAHELIGRRVFGDRANDPDHAIAVYERNTAEVRAALPRERLLVFTIGDGWAPLCQFLDVSVPPTPFPRTNSTVEFNARTAHMRTTAGPPR